MDWQGEELRRDWFLRRPVWVAMVIPAVIVLLTPTTGEMGAITIIDLAASPGGRHEYHRRQ
jgi:hypothetical protein